MSVSGGGCNTLQLLGRCRCEGEGSSLPITLCQCGLAIYTCPDRLTGWAHFRVQAHRAIPKKWMREDW